MIINPKRFYDPKFEAQSVTILPGEYFVTNEGDDMLVTILGSCVAACIRDKKLGVGGMNHFLLAKPNASILSPSNRYGSFAMEELINSIIKMGGRRENLEAKVFGGADILNSSIKVGNTNAEFVISYLKAEGISVVAEDLGGLRPRRIHFWPSSGRVVRLLVQAAENRIIERQENTFKEKLDRQPIGNPVELFI
jgi:chemotaxis protein CheD